MLNTIVIAGYLIIVIGLVFYFGRNLTGSTDFFLAGRQLGWIVVGGTILATAAGGATTVGHIGAFYSIGFDWFFIGIFAIAGSFFVAFFVAQKLRSLKQFTLPDIIELRYDGKSRLAAAVLII